MIPIPPIILYTLASIVTLTLSMYVLNSIGNSNTILIGVSNDIEQYYLDNIKIINNISSPADLNQVITIMTQELKSNMLTVKYAILDIKNVTSLSLILTVSAIFPIIFSILFTFRLRMLPISN